MIIKKCLNCKEEFKTWPYTAKTGRGKFCSRICKGQWMSKNLIGNKSPRWNGGKTTNNCLLCNREFQVEQCNIKKGWGKLCSKVCQYKWMSICLTGENRYNWKGGKISKNCQQCDKEFKSNPSSNQRFCSSNCWNKAYMGHIPWNKGKPNYNMRGANNHLWRGGITPLNEKIRKSLEYKEWRKSVFERDNYTCRACNKRGGFLNADHIKLFSIILLENNIKSFELALKCIALWNLDNGQTLCSSCHKIKTIEDMKNNWKNQFN